MRRVFILLFVILIMSSTIWLIFMVCNEGFRAPKALPKSEIFRILDEEYVPRDVVSSFQATDDGVYVFYDLRGLLNIYSPDGEFLYGIQFPTIKNGHGDFMVDDHVLYIKTRSNGIYVFDGKILQNLFTLDEAPEEYRRLTAQMEQPKNCTTIHGRYAYYPSVNKIVLSDDLGTRTVIELPQQNRNIEDLFFWTLMITSAFLYFLGHGNFNLSNKRCAS